MHPNCLSCCLKGRRPPQVWRSTRAIERGLGHLDALLFPSRHALEEHRRRGLDAFVSLVHGPYFLPDDWSGGIENEVPEKRARPYLAAAGRLVKMKGFQRLIPLMRYLPEVDLRIAGTGPHEPALRDLARDLPNVRFEGLWAVGRSPGSFMAPARSSCRRFSRRHSATWCSRHSRSERRSSLMKRVGHSTKPAFSAVEDWAIAPTSSC